MARLIRLDIINGNPRSFVANANLEQGLFLEIKGKAQNAELGVVDYEAYAVELAKADTARGQLLLHASVANQYDERLSEVDFVLEKGRVGRGYQPVMGDIVTIAKAADKIKADSGEIDLGINTHIAYYQQNPIFENTKLTVLEYIKESAEVITLNNGKTYSAGQLLEQFDFKGKIQYSPVETLSGGERKRLYLVRLLMSNPNFLILDEPTNDFDIFTMSILESFLDGYSGCLLVVSHDRYFVNKIASSLIVFDESGATHSK